MENLIIGLLFKKTGEAGHTFALNQLWKSLFDFELTISKDSSDGKTILDKSLTTTNKMQELLFEEKGNPLLNALT